MKKALISQRKGDSMKTYMDLRWVACTCSCLNMCYCTCGVSQESAHNGHVSATLTPASGSNPSSEVQARF